MVCPALSACQGGRVTLFDPASRALARQSAKAGASAASRAEDRAAARAFRHAIAFDARNGEAHAGLARLAVRRGDDDAAANHYRDAIKSAPGNGTYAVEFADLLARMAIHSLDRRQLGQSALRAYRYARTHVRYDADLALRHGLCAREHGQYDEAIACLYDAAALAPKSADVQMELARTYDMIGDPRAAYRARAEARRLEPDIREPLAATETDSLTP